MIPFPPWEPDTSIFDPGRSFRALNVLPKTGLSPDGQPISGYGPVPDISVLGAAVPAAVRGAFVARTDAGVAHIFCGTATKLYKWNATTASWDEVSNSATYTLATGESWVFTQFGADVIATNRADGAYVYTLGSSSDFLALGGTPPSCRCAAIVGDFLFLANTTSNNRILYWSGINDDTYWVAGSRLSDFQIFPDGGEIMGIVGWENSGLVFQRNAIRQVIPALSTEMIFQFVKSADGHGVISPQSIIATGNDVFYLAQDGFYRYGNPPIPIGQNRVNNFFFDSVDPLDLPTIQGAADPNGRRVFWRYRTSGSSNPAYTNQILVYDYSLDRWSRVGRDLTWLAALSTGGYTLDTLVQLNSSLDALTVSLDDPALIASKPTLCVFDKNNKMGTFAGSNLQGQLDTDYFQISPGRRAVVMGVRPISDASTMKCRVSALKLPGDTNTWSDDEQTISSADGIAYVRASGFYHRIRLTIPAGETWQYAHGVDIARSRVEGRQ